MPEQYRGYSVEIECDEDAPNPRKEFDNLGVMVCWHRNYDLGDKHDESWQRTPDDFIEWAEENARDIGLILPLYLYDHSGLRMKIGGFNGLLPQGHAEFDTMQVGFIYVTKAALREEYGQKRVSKKTLEHARKVLRAEVETFDQYISGDVWGYDIKALDDSCWGFFGYDYCLKEARDIIDYHIAHGGLALAVQNGTCRACGRVYGFREDVCPSDDCLSNTDDREKYLHNDEDEGEDSED